MRQFITKALPWLFLATLFTSFYLVEYLAAITSPANSLITAGAYLVAVFMLFAQAHHHLTTTPGGK